MVTLEKLIQQLEALGIGHQKLLMMHVSLRKTGPFEGGGTTLLDAILQTLNPEGTLLMVLSASDRVPFNALTSPAYEEVGTFAEIFRQHPDTKVNDHAAARFGAIGPRSTELLEPVPLHHYYGPGSVLSRFTASGGSVLRLGADENTITLCHWAEYLADIPNKRRVRRRYVREDIGEQWIESLDDCEGIAYYSGDDYFTQLWLDYKATGHVRVGPVGNCTAELFESGLFVDFATEWMEANL